MNGWRAWLIGCAQAAAYRAGNITFRATIFTGMLLGVNRERAARFSFILSIPAIVGAALLNGRALFYQAVTCLIHMVFAGRLLWCRPSPAMVPSSGCWQLSGETDCHGLGSTVLSWRVSVSWSVLWNRG
ncbi:MAG: undecaprenyl-diphosphate phosphatase [Desulfofustis sp. PB-SRB1]|nr:undecaprenyl-diphosphate phosphatase [Desulfofustis sp. PB-SRB1]